MISIVILTHNEVSNIDRFLASVEWSDDVLVIDSGSTDGTQKRAEAFGARVIYRSWDHFAGQRNYALDYGHLRYPWVLHLDADEVVTPELRSELLSITESPTTKLGYRIPFRLMFMGRWLKHSGVYPAYQVRFGSRDHLRFHMVGHGQRETLPPEEIGTLAGDLVHYNFSKGVSAWMSKHASYALDEALSNPSSCKSVKFSKIIRSKDPVERRRELKRLSEVLPFRPLLRFTYLYFWRGGLLDGRAGFRYALLIAVYQWMIDLNRVEILKGRADVE